MRGSHLRSQDRRVSTGRPDKRLVSILEGCALAEDLPASEELVAVALASADAVRSAASTPNQRLSVALLLGALAEQAARAERLNDPAVLLAQALSVADDPALATVLTWRVAGIFPTGAVAALQCSDRLETTGGLAVIRVALAAGGAVQAQAAVTLLEFTARDDASALEDCCALFASAGEQPGGTAAVAHLLIAAQFARRDELDHRIDEVLAVPPPGRAATSALSEYAGCLQARHPLVNEVLGRLADQQGVTPPWVDRAREV